MILLFLPDEVSDSLLRKQQVRLSLLKAGVVLFSHQDNLRQILSQPVTTMPLDPTCLLSQGQEAGPLPPPPPPPLPSAPEVKAHAEEGEIKEEEVSPENVQVGSVIHYSTK